MRDAGEQALGFMLLIYGVYSTDTESPSWQRFGRGAGLSQTQMRWIWETYLERPEQQNDWRAAPMPWRISRALPAAHLIVGALDPLLDDSHRLAGRLEEAGVPCELKVYEGLNHGFIRYGRLIAGARRAVGDCAGGLASKDSPRRVVKLRWRSDGVRGRRFGARSAARCSAGPWARVRLKAVLTSATCENACGKFPT